MELERKMSSERDEKLAAAKKKLKQFQQRRINVPYQNDENDPSIFPGQCPQDGDGPGHQRRLSSAISGCSTESLAESSQSVDHKVGGGSGSGKAGIRRLDDPGSASELPKLRHSSSGFPFSGGGFYHDEHRSPFQPVKKTSECSDSTLVRQNNDLEERYNAISDDYVNKSLQNTNDNNNSDNNNDNKNPLNDQDRSNFMINQSQNDVINNLNNNFYANNVINYDNSTYKDPVSTSSVQHFQNFDPNFRQIEEKIDQNQLKGLDDENLANFLATIKFPENLAIDFMNDDNVKKIAKLILQHKMGYDSALQQQNEYLQAYNNEISMKCEELNGNYAQLHAAYTNLVESYSKDINGSNKISMTDNEQELRNQLQQHLQTMSILVEEKSDLQSQLRQAMEIANAKNVENEELQGRLKANRQRLVELERENDVTSSSKQALESSFERQTTELQRVRQESAQLQARLAEIVQDKSELNVRYKSRCREYDELVKRAKELESHVTMKDIYIQQLTGGQKMVSNDEFEHFRRENAYLKSELDNSRQLAEKFRRESEQSKERYESYGQQLNAKILELSTEIENLSSEKFDLTTKLQILQEEFENFKISQQQLNVSMATNESDDEKNLLHLQNLHKLNDEVKNLEENLHRITEENANLQITLNEKNNIITHINDAGQEKDAKIRQLEDYLNTLSLADSNTKSLLEQLHNEKATSSRSIAQNLALKNQLVELEEKIIVATNNEMEITTKFQTAEHAVHKLEQKLAEKDEEIGKLTVQHNEQFNNLKSQVNMMLKQDYDRKQLEDRLHHYEVTQKATHDELLRSRGQLEALSSENADLRNQLDQSRRDTISASTNSRQGFTASEMGRNENLGLNEAGNNAVNYDALMMREEMAQATQRIQQLSAENSELHRIMEQNAADENQNTIHVELRQAVERLTLLSNENEDLRRTVAELLTEKEAQNQRERNVLTTNSGGNTSRDNDGDDKSQKNLLDDHSSVCSDHYEQKRDAVSAEAFVSLKSAMEQLQNRFKRAVTENADLSDQNEQLEHLIVKLQSETETIGEYVTIYRHQRQIMREKMREKEEFVAKLSRENAAIQAKLIELQNLIMHLLKEKGALQSYPQLPPTHAKPPRAPPSKVPPRPKKLSETVVDETSGSDRSGHNSPEPRVMKSPSLDAQISIEKTPNEEIVHNSGDTSPTFGSDHNFSLASIHHAVQNALSVESRDQDGSVQSNNEPSSLFIERSGTAEKILKLLYELQKPDFVKNLPPSERNLHCKYCTGNLIML